MSELYDIGIKISLRGIAGYDALAYFVGYENRWYRRLRRFFSKRDRSRFESALEKLRCEFNVNLLDVVLTKGAEAIANEAVQ